MESCKVGATVLAAAEAPAAEAPAAASLLSTSLTTMLTLTNRQWEILYYALWRAPFADRTPAARSHLVRGCRGKVIYESLAEASRIVETLPSLPGKVLGCYVCPLCHGMHIGNTSLERTRVRWRLNLRRPYQVPAWVAPVKQRLGEIAAARAEARAEAEAAEAKTILLEATGLTTTGPAAESFQSPPEASLQQPSGQLPGRLN